MKKQSDYIGYSSQGIKDALENALLQADHPEQYEIVETRTARDKSEQRHYQVTLKSHSE